MDHNLMEKSLQTIIFRLHGSTLNILNESFYKYYRYLLKVILNIQFKYEFEINK